MSDPAVHERNLNVLIRLSRFLQGNALLGEAEVRQIASECGLSLEEAARIMLGACIGLDLDLPEDFRADSDYLQPGFRLLNPSRYNLDAYRQCIEFPKTEHHGWTFAEQAFEPFEVFLRDDLLVLPDGREIPQIGTFETHFCYPVVKQHGREWMTLAPVEIESMKGPVRASHGHVLALGLGLGYYAFHAVRKPEVTRVTVVEQDGDLIRMFRDELLPQFPDREKLEIIEADAYDFLSAHLPLDGFDEVFCDIWHDAWDGLPHYRRLRRIEAKSRPHFTYWVENLLRQQDFIEKAWETL